MLSTLSVFSNKKKQDNKCNVIGKIFFKALYLSVFYKSYGHNLVLNFGFLSVKKSTLTLTALPEVKSTAVAMISVSPNFICT